LGTWGIAFEERSDGGWMYMLGVGVAGADFPTGGEATMSEESI